MALKVKAVERLLKFSNNPNDPGVYRYVMKADLYTKSESGKGYQGGCNAQRRKSGCDEGLLGCCWRGNQSMGN